MATYRDADGREFDLPKMTVALEDAYDRAADRSRPKRERARDAFKLMRDALGAEYVKEACGGGTAETVDVTRLWTLFGDVRHAYFGEAEAADMERVMAQLEGIAPMLDRMAQVSRLVEASQTRQGFTRVV